MAELEAEEAVEGDEVPSPDFVIEIEIGTVRVNRSSLVNLVMAVSIAVDHEVEVETETEVQAHIRRVERSALENGCVVGTLWSVTVCPF